MILWHKRNNPWHRRNIAIFRDIMSLRSDVVFVQPNPDDAPWHLQAVVGGKTLNFWPHLLKGNVEGQKAVEGKSALLQMIAEAELDDDIGDLIE